MTAMTIKGRNVWNPVWLAPEIMGKKEYTEKADVYGYGTSWSVNGWEGWRGRETNIILLKESCCGRC